MNAHMLKKEIAESLTRNAGMLETTNGNVKLSDVLAFCEATAANLATMYAHRLISEDGALCPCKVCA